MVSFAVLFPIVRKRSGRAKRLAATAAAGVVGLWSVLTVLQVRGWAFDAVVIAALAANVLMVGALYPILALWDRLRAQAAEASARSTATREEEARGAIIILSATGMLLVLGVGCILWFFLP